MEVQSNHYYAKNEKGDILFKIELSSIEGFPWLQFDCSLNLDLFKYHGLKNKIEKLCGPETSPEEKAALVQKIISQVKKIEGVENLFYKNTDPVEEPLPNGIVKLLNYIFSQEEFHEYTPFSNARNTYFFEVLKKKLAIDRQINKMTVVSKSSFEEIIKGQKNLEDEYVNQYSSNATFYSKGIRWAEVNYEFYFMKTDKVVMIFYIEA